MSEYTVEKETYDEGTGAERIHWFVRDSNGSWAKFFSKESHAKDFAYIMNMAHKHRLFGEMQVKFDE